ncbi:PhzF family phenazine biosynthesis protein [Tamlana sp. 62-3]|uniref:PhzF family phenazine biosynthesis protein n=1 Tax=Neotamlana sargassicola TaxID=2883125 RepID=A0A9X1L343_9FLAO|nr:PhzF family phenazine biosynthesis protein [Tamlana sargassicola]MCB4806677.1 PhzF family phenazine biosynthesis protein [Tamlana sargassicola]
MLNNSIIYQVDAFAEEAFKGNPAGVMLLKEEVSEAWMQNMAMEMNLSETAFVFPKNDYFEIKYYTPTVEIPLCGHATLASAHIMYSVGLVPTDRPIHFKAKGGDLVIHYENGFIAMEFPEYQVSATEIPVNFESLLGFMPKEMYKSEANWFMAIAENQKNIENCSPNFEALNANGLGHLMISAEATHKEADFVVRCFVPESGINEDPVTGSAHCALTPLWAKKLNKNNLVSHQISKRGGALMLNYSNNKVKIKGKAITVFKADLSI